MLVFLVIALVAAALFAGTLFFGDADLDVGGGHDHDGIISVRSLLLFCIGFGASAALAKAYDQTLTVSMVMGVAAGVGMAAAGVKATKLLFNQEGDSTLRIDDILSRSGRLTFVDGDMGEVVLSDKMGRALYRRANVPAGAKVGDLVRIESASGDVLSVSVIQ